MNIKKNVNLVIYNIKIIAINKIKELLTMNIN